MSDTNFKRLDELEVIEEAGESTYAVVEENGVPKRIPGKKIGGGLPEGGAPYQQLVTDGQGNAKWEDKPFGSTEVNFKWDGDESNPNYDANAKAFFVTDTITKPEQLNGLNFVLSEVELPVSTFDLVEDEEDANAPKKYDSEVGVINGYAANQVLPGVWSLVLNAYIPATQLTAVGYIIIAETEMVSDGGITVKPGLYFSKNPGGGQAFVSAIYGESVTRIEDKYMPVVAMPIIFKDDGDNLTCNVDYYTFGNKLISGAPMVYIMMSDSGITYESRISAEFGGNYGNRFVIRVETEENDQGYFNLSYSPDALERELL